MPARGTIRWRRAHAAHIFLGHGDHHAQARRLLNDQQHDIGARSHQRAGVHQAIGDHARKRRGDLQVLLQVALRLDRGSSGLRCLLARPHQSLRRIHLFLRLHHVVASHHAGSLGGLLQPFECALGSGKLRLGLQAVGLGRLHLGFGLGDTRGHFRSAERGQQLALFYLAAAVHQHALHIARNLGVHCDAEEGIDFARKFHGARNRPGDDRCQLDGSGREPWRRPLPAGGKI